MSDVMDLKAATICARVFLALHHPKAPPRWAVEHLAHLEALAAGYAGATESEAGQIKSELIGTAEAARILGYSRTYVRTPKMLAALDAQPISGRWSFDKKVVQEYAVSRQ